MAAFIPLGVFQLRAEFDQIVDAEVLTDLFQVTEDFRLASKQMAPLAAQGKGKRIQGGRDITTTARIGIFPPGPADTVGFLDDLEIVIALFLHLDGGTQTGDAGTNNKGVVNPGLRGGFFLSRWHGKYLV